MLIAANVFLNKISHMVPVQNILDLPFTFSALFSYSSDSKMYTPNAAFPSSLDYTSELLSYLHHR